jgi:hypothetical protein
MVLEKMSAQRASGSRCLIFVYSDSWIVLLECAVKFFRKRKEKRKKKRKKKKKKKKKKRRKKKKRKTYKQN